MRERVLIDNDVLLKIAAWQLDGALLTAMTTPAGLPAMLGVGRFVVGRRIRRRGLVDPAAAAASFDRLCAALTMTEPEPADIAMAAELEEAATRAGLELDVGESQLLAMLIAHDARLLLTGDKRAIVAIAGLGQRGMQGRVAALEQLIRVFVERLELEPLRGAICAERSADTSLAICFGCHRSNCSAAEIDAGLESYCGDLERCAGAILIAQADLLALSA